MRLLLSELIDTQWDVNIIVEPLGCKAVKYVKQHTDVNIIVEPLDNSLDGELIDTQWDVNGLEKSVRNRAYTELIDTQWDVNKVYWSLKDIKNEN